MILIALLASAAFLTFDYARMMPGRCEHCGRRVYLNKARWVDPSGTRHRCPR